MALHFINQALHPSFLYLVEGAPTTTISQEILQKEFTIRESNNQQQVWSHDNEKPLEENEDIEGETHCKNTIVDDEEYKQENKQVEAPVKYDEESLSNEEWLKIIQEVELIDGFLMEEDSSLKL